MSAAAVSDLRTGQRLIRFLMTGVGATLLYALLAAMFSAGRPIMMDPVAGSVIAYAVASAFSYAGHKYFTFSSGGAHRFEAPRFVVLTLLGLAISFAFPAILSGKLGLPAQIPIVLTCLFVPVVNYVVLRHWVFGKTLARPRNGSL